MSALSGRIALVTGGSRGIGLAISRALAASGGASVPELIGAASEDPDLTTRGWAIVALGRIGGPEAGKALDRLSNDAKAPPLVKVWAGGARIHMAQNLDEVLALQPLVNAQPALKRPFGLRIRALMIVNRVGERHENRSLSEHGQFRHRGRPGAAQDQVGRRVSLVHLLNKGSYFRFKGKWCIGALDHRKVRLSGLMNDPELRSQIGQFRESIDQRDVDAMSPQTPAED